MKNRLRELREETGLSQAQFAKIIGVVQASYQRWESGKQDISVERLIAMADYFGVSIDYILFRAEDRGVKTLIESEFLDKLSEQYGREKVELAHAVAKVLK